MKFHHCWCWPLPGRNPSDAHASKQIKANEHFSSIARNGLVPDLGGSESKHSVVLRHQTMRNERKHYVAFRDQAMSVHVEGLCASSCTFQFGFNRPATKLVFSVPSKKFCTEQMFVLVSMNIVRLT